MAIIVSISTIPRMLQPTNLIFFFFYSISYFIFSICSWVRPEYFLIRLMSTPSASMFLAISKAFSFLPSCFAVSIAFLISRYAILLASYVLWIQIRHVLHNLSAIKQAVEEANEQILVHCRSKYSLETEVGHQADISFFYLLHNHLY